MIKLSTVLKREVGFIIELPNEWGAYTLSRTTQIPSSIHSGRLGIIYNVKIDPSLKYQMPITRQWVDNADHLLWDFKTFSLRHN